MIELGVSQVLSNTITLGAGVHSLKNNFFYSIISILFSQLFTKKYFFTRFFLRERKKPGEKSS